MTTQPKDRTRGPKRDKWAQRRRGMGRFELAASQRRWERNRVDTLAAGLPAVIRAIDEIRYLMRVGGMEAMEALLTVRFQAQALLEQELGAVNENVLCGFERAEAETTTAGEEAA